MNKKEMVIKLKRLIMESEIKNDSGNLFANEQGYTMSKLVGGNHRKEKFTKTEIIEILSEKYDILDSIIKDIGEDNIGEIKLTWSVNNLGSFLPVSGYKIDIIIEFYTKN